MAAPDVDPQWLRTQLAMPQYPRSSAYDPRWMVDHAMGPNPLWLLEALSERMTLEPGQRVLDLGCGKALTSIFLAKEFGVQVHAADLWIAPGENLARVREAGCSDAVFPLHAEAHDLKYPQGYFDAVVSIDAYHYFGTDDLYIGYLTPFVRPGGWIGIVVPSLTAEIDAVPAHAEPYWEWEFACLHSPAWWRHHWERTGRVKVEACEAIPDGWRHWLRWVETCAVASPEEWVRTASQREAEMLRIDAGRTFGFTLLLARVPDAS